MRISPGIMSLVVAMAVPASFGEPAAGFSWQQPQAEVVETGDLRWSPRPFVLEAGGSRRYIDFEAGSDANGGESRNTPWRHHPWDARATGKAQACRGIHTYVFKRGVVYRGALVARESGRPGDPIRLTSDPSWGQGEAILQGSEAVGGWRRGSGRRDIPDPDRVWQADVDFLARRVWEVDGSGVATRIPLARTPNWAVSDPEDVLSEWWVWENPQWWVKENRTTTVNTTPMHLGIDRKNLTQGAEYYRGAIVWTEWAIVMGTPFPTRVEAVDAERRALAFQGRWWRDSGQINAGNRYFLEDKPEYLDDPNGEFWFERDGDAERGRLYLRLRGDRDPNSVTVEAARHYSLIQDQASRHAPPRLDTIGQERRDALDTTGVAHIVISGLTFRFNNAWWDYEQPPWMHKEIDNAAIRLRGSGDAVRIAHCRLEHVSKAVRIEPVNDRATFGSVAITDSEIRFTDHGAIKIGARGGGGALKSVRVMRNRLTMIGMRPYRQSDGHALTISFPQTMEVAGNILDRCYGAGIFVFGGKASGQGGEAPLSRHLIYQNRVVDALLATNDWGGIETWQGGPFYVFNNISGNPNGFWNWSYQNNRTSPDRNARLGYAYYLDGSFKNYLFNNIAWGRDNDPASRTSSNSAFYQAVPAIHNAFFNNTAYRFKQGSGWSPAGGRQLFLGNIWQDISLTVFNHGRQKEDADAAYKAYPHETIAYSGNVFHQVPDEVRHLGGDGQRAVVRSFGALEGSGHGPGDLAGFRRMAAERRLLAADVGVMSPSAPLRDPGAGDFRPAPGSEAIDRGVRVFVPWGLYAMVGEWHFRRNNADPAAILDEHWFMTDTHVQREDYRLAPAFHLRGVNIAAKDYVEGDLEDWTASALRLNGRDQYAAISQAELTRPYVYRTRVGREEREVTIGGADLASPDIHRSNLLVEIVFRTEPGHAGGVLLAKLAAGAGYQLGITENGGVAFAVADGSRIHRVAAAARINDGRWHHVIAELDRAAGTGTVYVDGRLAGSGAIALAAEASLANPGDLLVGRGPDGAFFAGAIDFLRIARGTLADARTSIEELYAWQFDGPSRRDFAGRRPIGRRRDAGALELTAQ